MCFNLWVNVFQSLFYESHILKPSKQCLHHLCSYFSKPAKYCVINIEDFVQPNQVVFYATGEKSSKVEMKHLFAIYLKKKRSKCSIFLFCRQSLAARASSLDSLSRYVGDMLSNKSCCSLFSSARSSWSDDVPFVDCGSSNFFRFSLSPRHGGAYPRP